MTEKTPWPVTTDRLVLRPARAEDADAMWEYRRRPDVDRWLSDRLAGLDAWRSFQTDPERLAATLIVERDGEVIGDLYLAVRDGWAQRDAAGRPHQDEAEIGWVLSPDHQGHGYATEAVRALLRVCFEELGVRRLVANAFADNEASWRLMERVGMRREAVTVRASLHRDLGWVDGVTYALLADEWAA
ncbi:GNAT family protein [Leifsonia sp. F6_8S_P_1B]|uniref:GNAT family protein n=1 Tax=Leifsonia williamsii TaxID=3035919 RepID=A0ABT8K8Z6_9MICO|nr:GNAT family protein [Leifsonia williamsii]MDN4613928.1 GNAT family protein [Leifsonia williamsii]